MPISASLSASTSPSPVIATVWPRLQRRHYRLFLMRAHPAEYRALLQHTAELAKGSRFRSWPEVMGGSLEPARFRTLWRIPGLADRSATTIPAKG